MIREIKDVRPCYKPFIHVTQVHMKSETGVGMYTAHKLIDSNFFWIYNTYCSAIQYNLCILWIRIVRVMNLIGLYNAVSCRWLRQLQMISSINSEINARSTLIQMGQDLILNIYLMFAFLGSLKELHPLNFLTNTLCFI